MLGKDHAAREAVSERYTPFSMRKTGHNVDPEQHLSRRAKVSCQVMREKFFSKLVSMCDSAPSIGKLSGKDAPQIKVK
jgi:hypothetical protein